MKEKASKPETNVAVVEPQTKAVATEAPPRAPMGVLAGDVILPQLLLMQGLSDFVTERKAQLGDMVKYPTAEKMGDPEHPVEFIPLAPPRATWVLEQKNAAGKFEYRKVVERNAANEMDPWSFLADVQGNPVAPGTPNATEWRRVKRLSLFAILPQDIVAEAAEMAKAAKGEMPDLSKAMTPVLINFRSTSFNAGKDVVTFVTQAAKFKQPVWKYSLVLKCYLDKNDQGTFYVYQVDRAHPKAVDSSYLPQIEEWANMVKKPDAVQVHEPIEAESGPVGGGIC